MNAKLVVMIALAAGLGVWAEESPPVAGPGKPAEAKSIPAEMPPAPSPAPPVVRLPVPVTTTPVTEPAPPAGSGAPAGSMSGSAQLGWSRDGTELRVPANPTIRTNRSWETRGALPRLTRPERRTFGGFVVGFANLFNPFAPTDQGVGGTSGHWYDGQLNAAPLPRAFRDERSHEASWDLISIPLERDPAKPEAKPGPVPAPVR